jgi:hypothetical protein
MCAHHAGPNRGTSLCGFHKIHRKNNTNSSPLLCKNTAPSVLKSIFNLVDHRMKNIVLTTSTKFPFHLRLNPEIPMKYIETQVISVSMIPTPPGFKLLTALTFYAIFEYSMVTFQIF